jgi:hypothetical protein
MRDPKAPRPPSPLRRPSEGVTVVSASKHREWPRSRVPPASDEGAHSVQTGGGWSEPAAKVDETPDVPSERERFRAVAARVITALAVLVVWFSMIFPDQLSRFTPGVLLRLPVEVMILVALGLVLPRAWRRAMAMVVGLVLGLVAVLKLVDLGFYFVLGQPFNPLTDMSYLKSAVGFLRGSAGPYRTAAVVAAATLVLVAVLVLVIWSALRLTRFTAQHRAASSWTVCALAAVWLLCAALGVQVAGAPVASTGAAAFTHKDVDSAAPAADDAFATATGQALLTGLRGKDVLIVFVESYGRVAVEDPAISPEVNGVLTRGTDSLRAAGFSTRSAFLTSPTFAGISWLAHSTLQSGLWIDNQQRYDQLVQTDRLTLTGAFKRAGWRTVAAVPANTQDWPQGASFYHYDTIYDQRSVGYAGPSFSYASMPDQYTLAALQRNELAQPHSPVMAEIDLVSSHGPWVPLPRMVDWKAVGDGSIFADMPAQGQSPDELVGHPDRTKAAYGQSIQYSMSALISFVQTFHDDDLVVVAVGDHQPASVVSGKGASNDVPITIIAHDPDVMSRIASWGWQPGMLPNSNAPVWPMDAFRDRFLTAYGPQHALSTASASPTPTR